jgi:hypothetical protein
MVFPLIWLVYTMLRGGQVYWYPYFFLDPALTDIPYELGFYLVIVVAIFTGTVALLIGISRLPRLEHVRDRLATKGGGGPTKKAGASAAIRNGPGQRTAQGSP